jgi:hypothetical protein
MMAKLFLPGTGKPNKFYFSHLSGLLAGEGSAVGPFQHPL